MDGLSIAAIVISANIPTWIILLKHESRLARIEGKLCMLTKYSQLRKKML